MIKRWRRWLANAIYPDDQWKLYIQLAQTLNRELNTEARKRYVGDSTATGGVNVIVTDFGTLEFDVTSASRSARSDPKDAGN